ncbi:MAG: nuclear transport factor 2 family protein [Alteraurantiacibacter sp.]|nr:nuclear transport factor 2 family protein [Alteraurantiacibacter sp.]
MPDIVADRIAICELKAQYCRLLDTKDWEGWSALFTEDFVQDVSGSGGGVHHGRAAAVAATRAAIELAKTAHQVHSPEIVIDGDTATGIWALQDRLHWPDGSKLTGYGHYHERYVRQDGRWRIAELRLTRLIMEHEAP